MASTKDLLVWVREGAARQLEQLLKSSDKRMELASYEALKLMEGDDSLTVRNLVSQILKEYVAKKAAETAKPPGIRKGRLWVETNSPDAVVKILNLEAEFAGGMELEPGRYELEVSADGYETKKEWLELEPEEEKHLSISLAKLKAHLWVETNPKNAAIKILNSKVKFAQGIELEPGRYELEVSADGYETAKEWVVLGAGEKKPIPIKLTPVTEYPPVHEIPAKARRVAYACTAIILLIGATYTFSIWVLISSFRSVIVLVNSIASVLVFALVMLYDWRFFDRVGPKLIAIIGGVLIAIGFIWATFWAPPWDDPINVKFVVMYGIIVGIGIGIGYATSLSAMLKWLGPHQWRIIARFVVIGFGGVGLIIALVFVTPIYSGENYPRVLRASAEVGLGFIFFVILLFSIAVSKLSWPKDEYVPPTPSVQINSNSVDTALDWTPAEAAKTWQLYALIFLFIGSTQSGLVVFWQIASNLEEAFYRWNHVIFYSTIMLLGGLAIVAGGIVTNKYSSIIGLRKVYSLNCLVSAFCLFVLSYMLEINTVQEVRLNTIILTYMMVFLILWQFGGGVTLMFSYTVEFFGPKKLGMNYSLVFLSCGLAYLMTFTVYWIIRWIKGSEYYVSQKWYFSTAAVILITSVIVAQFTKKPTFKPA